MTPVRRGWVTNVESVVVDTEAIYGQGKPNESRCYLMLSLIPKKVKLNKNK